MNWKTYLALALAVPLHHPSLAGTLAFSHSHSSNPLSIYLLWVYILLFISVGSFLKIKFKKTRKLSSQLQNQCERHFKIAHHLPFPRWTAFWGLCLFVVRFWTYYASQESGVDSCSASIRAPKFGNAARRKTQCHARHFLLSKTSLFQTAI